MKRHPVVNRLHGNMIPCGSGSEYKVNCNEKRSFFETSRIFLGKGPAQKLNLVFNHWLPQSMVKIEMIGFVDLHLA